MSDRDITQSDGENGEIVFSADTTAGDNWMQSQYGEIRVSLEISEARDFKQSAEAAGLIVAGM